MSGCDTFAEELAHVVGVLLVVALLAWLLVSAHGAAETPVTSPYPDSSVCATAPTDC